MHISNRLLVSILPLLLLVASTAGASSNMALQQTATGAAAGVTPPPGLRWVHFAHHTHTDYSDGRDTVRNRILEAASFGADSVSICDHNTIEQCNDPWFIEQDGCIPMCGDEWGGMGRGHACVLNMTGNETLDVRPDGTLYSLDEMLPQMLARGGTIFINHPFDDGNPWPHGFAHAGICGAAVWTTPFPNADARGWWAAHITHGRILVAIGESDHHLERILSTAISNSLVPCNYVLASSAQPADVQEALEAGRIAVAGSKGAARAFVWCDQDGDGIYETPMGTNIVVTQPKRLRFRVEVYDGAGILGNVMVYSNNGGLKTTLGSGSPWRIDYEADVTADTKDYLRAELRGAFGVFQSITNPIYINYAPTVTLSADPADPVNGPIAVAATLSAATGDFHAGDIAVTNATVSGFSGGGNSYSFLLAPVSEGLFSCQVPAAVFHDAVGNINLASATLSRTYLNPAEGEGEGEGEGGGEGEGEGEG
ncbi:MAG TPA: CehA/McbA family metallohydrolase, partial [Candidatus Hydrogenedentes bacterium]|nr:CehA/McbA family metallohydrolase [Candidatus Hydrogenedentota bacterium]